MATRRSAPPPEPPALSVDQMRRRIGQFQQCIDELEAFDPQQVQKRYAEPQVIRLEAMIGEALDAAFGHGTPAYNRYRGAARLDHGPHVMRTGTAFGRGPQIDYDARDALDARRYFAEGKAQSIALLHQAISTLEYQIADQEPALHASPVEGVAAPVFNLSQVFVVHGHDGEPREAVARFLERLGFEAIILHERANKGRTIITKFREEAAEVGFAVVLMTPDDIGKAENARDLQARARQNVVFELGFFIGALGPDRVAALVKGDIERPSDFDGVVYISLDDADWRVKLGRELQAAGYKIDWNKVMQ